MTKGSAKPGDAGDHHLQADDQAVMPDAQQWMPVTWTQAPHPATLSIDQLLTSTQNRFQRRSGPGGQHRNKTSSGVFLVHQPTHVSAEATERRSQASNRDVAVMRLRYKLAVHVRTPSIFSALPDPVEQSMRQKYVNRAIKLNDANADKPAVMALLLNDLHAAGGQPSLVAQRWQTSTSSILKCLRGHPDSFLLLNTVRRHHGRRVLK